MGKFVHRGRVQQGVNAMLARPLRLVLVRDHARNRPFVGIDGQFLGLDHVRNMVAPSSWRGAHRLRLTCAVAWPRTEPATLFVALSHRLMNGFFFI
jgi:hypothetical protein